MKKISPKQVNLYFLLIFAIGAVLGAIGALSEIKPLAIIGITLLIGDIIFRIACYRCSYCGRYLDRSRGEYCPYCGKELNH